MIRDFQLNFMRIRTSKISEISQIDPKIQVKLISVLKSWWRPTIHLYTCLKAHVHVRRARGRYTRISTMPLVDRWLSGYELDDAHSSLEAYKYSLWLTKCWHVATWVSQNEAVWVIGLYCGLRRVAHLLAKRVLISIARIVGSHRPFFDTCLHLL